jgi:peptidoglycan/xylan/chitin deacetylase (PgdA/CDA1 family)
MVTSPDLVIIHPHNAENQPWVFWRLLDSRILPEDWMDAIRAAMGCLEGLPVVEHNPEPSHLMADILSEVQFGPDHWRLSRFKQLYYQLVRPLLPDFLRTPLRTLLLSRQRNGFTLNWPIEDRYVRFQFEIVARLMANKQLDTISYIHFWPAGKQFAFVLTHDVEAEDGQNYVREVAALEERYGFRSSFNFVPEKYRVDLDLISELKERGFEVGVHGLKHDGRLFSSKAVFDGRVKRINCYLKQWGAVGFRSPMTHRNPEWMQALDIEYDLSFFDTDPYEMIPGGTMSIWPFQMGRFIELPYTLPQDHTLMVTVGQTSPRLWLEKVDFIEKYCGMALVNAHPDYLKDPRHFAIYEAFLQQMRERDGYWHALPREVARWWKKRAAVSMASSTEGNGMIRADEFDFVIGHICHSESSDDRPVILVSGTS